MMWKYLGKLISNMMWKCAFVMMLSRLQPVQPTLMSNCWCSFFLCFSLPSSFFSLFILILTLTCGLVFILMTWLAGISVTVGCLCQGGSVFGKQRPWLQCRCRLACWNQLQWCLAARHHHPDPRALLPVHLWDRNRPTRMATALQQSPECSDVPPGVHK